MIQQIQHRRRIVLAVFGALLAVGWFVYTPALTGTFLLDDQGNLGGLKHVEDWRSALQFVASGNAGPVGRPLALASFLPQASSMEAGPRAFLQFNILLHLFNASLLAYFFYCLSVARKTEPRTALIVAVSAAAVWLFMPLLASASLMAVQRMTTLAASFILLALIGYLHSRRAIDTDPRKALTRMSVAVVAGTALSVLTKESGVLLPTLILAMEVTILERPKTLGTGQWRAWMLAFLALPTLLVIGYLATTVPYSELTALKRDFNGWERLLTQSRILWEYLFNAFVPRPAQFGPFHDGYPVARTIFDPLTFISVAAWMAVAAWAIRFRRRYPIVAFGILWYLGGHLLESTVLHLELYFEHRNYVPIIGPVFALCFLAFRVPVAKRKLVYAALPLYAAVNVAVLVGLTSLWGQPAVAAYVWQERNPDSVRAATHLASYEMAIHGHERALARVEEFVRTHPDDGYLSIQELKLRCIFFPQDDHRQRLKELGDSLLDVSFDYISGTALTRLAIRVDRNECNGVDLEAVESMARTLIRNPRYRQDVLYNQIHHQILALIAKMQEDYPEAIRHLKRAIEYQPEAALNAKMVDIYAAAGKFPEARAFIESARKNAPAHPLKRHEWISMLDDLSEFVTTVEQRSGPGDRPQ